MDPYVRIAEYPRRMEVHISVGELLLSDNKFLSQTSLTVDAINEHVVKLHTKILERLL